MANKYALLIGTSEYNDERLARLKTPAADVDVLADLLGKPEIGGYEVKLLLNEQYLTVLKEIAIFLKNKFRDDNLLLYISGHGVLDEDGTLYLAAKDTDRDLLSATALSSKFIKDEMDRSRSKRQVLILDCCHSGAFLKGTKGAGPALTHSTFEGYGRAVLAAADSVQYALEGDQVEEGLELSLFTHALAEGIQSGEADQGKDGWIDLDEWFDYADRKVRDHTDKQTPRKFVDNQYGELFIARNPRASEIRPAELPERLRARMKSEYRPDRMDAIQELQGLLDNDDSSMVMAAKNALERMAKEDDSDSIKDRATSILKQYTERQAIPKVEGEPLAREQAEAERQAALKAEAEHQVAPQAEEVSERVDAERVATLKAEEERPTLERAETDRQATVHAEEDRRTRVESELLAELAEEEEQSPVEETPIAEGGWLGLRAEIRYATPVWVSAFLHPSAKTYEALVNNPRASARRAFIWMLASAFVFNIGLLLTVAILNASLPPMDAALFFLAIILSGIIAVFYLFAGAVHWISHRVGGRSRYSRLVYANAAFTAPLLLLSSIPLLNFVFILAWIYAIVLAIIAIRAVYQFGWGKAIAVYTSSLLVFVLLMVIVYIFLIR